MYPASIKLLPEDVFSTSAQRRTTNLPPQQKPAAPMGRAVDSRKVVKKLKTRGLVKDWRWEYRKGIMWVITRSPGKLGSGED